MIQKQIAIYFVVFCLFSKLTHNVVGQTESFLAVFPPDHGVEPRCTSLPNDRNLRNEGGLPLGLSVPPDLPYEDRHSQNILADFKGLLRPRVNIAAEWEPRTDGFEIASFDLSIQMPVYPVYGPPPPLITSNYSFAQVDAPATADLPSNLHEFSLGLAWMRPINEKWMMRFTLNGAFASDLNNTGSDAWQLRGGVFALIRPCDQWNFAFGALATGRDDIPVLPAIGAIWEPTPEIKINLMLPNPRFSILLADSEKRQQWGYVGGGISGGTWAYNRSGGQAERLTYREWRVVLGWESIPPQLPGTFRPRGTRIYAEVGYVFGRKFEFDGNFPDISIDNTLLLRTGIGF